MWHREQVQGEMALPAHYGSSKEDHQWISLRLFSRVCLCNLCLQLAEFSRKFEATYTNISSHEANIGLVVSLFSIEVAQLYKEPVQGRPIIWPDLDSDENLGRVRTVISIIEERHVPAFVESLEELEERAGSLGKGCLGLYLQWLWRDRAFRRSPWNKGYDYSLNWNSLSFSRDDWADAESDPPRVLPPTMYLACDFAISLDDTSVALMSPSASMASRID